jgi:hypothetical protein
LRACARHDARRGARYGYLSGPCLRAGVRLRVLYGVEFVREMPDTLVEPVDAAL